MEEVFERKLYVVRKRAESEVAASDMKTGRMFYIPSLSSRTIVYKGLLLAPQIARFLRGAYDPDVDKRALPCPPAFLNEHFSQLAARASLPLRCHNGEINTLRGNVNWMHARQSILSSPLFDDDIKKLFPVISPGGSDSASFDNAVELLYHSGRDAACDGDADSGSVGWHPAHEARQARVL